MPYRELPFTPTSTHGRNKTLYVTYRGHGCLHGSMSRTADGDGEGVLGLEGVLEEGLDVIHDAKEFGVHLWNGNGMTGDDGLTC